MNRLCKKCKEFSNIDIWGKSKGSGGWICPKCGNKGKSPIVKKKEVPVKDRFEILDL